MPAPAVFPLMRVATTWALPGLGLLALSEGASSQLATYALHTALSIEAVLPAGDRHCGIATVEEITRPEITERGLLLEFGQDFLGALPPGTELWLIDAQPASDMAGLL